jgi:hypothetical protein
MNMKRKIVILMMAFLFALAIAIVISGCSSKDDTTIQTTSADVPSTTKILDSSSLNKLASVFTDGTQLTFSGTTSQISSLNVGDIVVSDASSSVAPYGMLKKITSINTSGDQVIVNTTGATIEEAIQKGSWSITQSLDSNQTVSAAIVAKGVGIRKSTSLGKFEVSINDVELADGVFANGSITIEPSYTFSGSVDNFTLKSLTFTNTTKETCSISLSSSASLVDYSKTVEIARYNMPTVTVWVGYFPIVITPVLTVNVGLSGNVSVGISTGIEQEATFTNGLSYDSSSGWSTIKDQTKSFTFNPPTVTAAATAKCYAGPKIELLLYGCAGPYASADGYLEFDANPSDNPWWQLYGGIEASAGVELTIVSHLVASYSANIFDERVLIAQADGGYTPNSYTISGQVLLNGAGLSGVKVTLTGTGSNSALTKANGEYTFTNAADGSYTVTPSLTGYIFSPSSIAVNVSGTDTPNINFTATANTITYSMSGTIHSGSNSGAVLSGATVSIAGKTYTTGSADTFTITGIPAGTYAFSVSKSGYYTYTNSAYYVGSNQTGLSFYLTATNPIVAQTPMSVNPGGTVTQSGTGFTPNSTATLHFRKPDNSEFTPSSQAIGSDGTFSITYTIPTDRTTGTYTWWGVDSSGVVSNIVSFIVANVTISNGTLTGINGYNVAAIVNIEPNYGPNNTPISITVTFTSGASLVYDMIVAGANESSSWQFSQYSNYTWSQTSSTVWQAGDRILTGIYGVERFYAVTSTGVKIAVGDIWLNGSPNTEIPDWQNDGIGGVGVARKMLRKSNTAIGPTSAVKK